MKTVFDNAVRDELIRRIQLLQADSQAQWGRMNVYQMARHCVIWNEWVLGKNNPVYKQALLGKIFGKWALKSNTKDSSLMKKKMPAGSAFTVKGDGDADEQKKIWISLTKEFGQYSNPAFIHDFFGKMTTEEIGIFAYKHMDHHLRQFGV